MKKFFKFIFQLVIAIILIFLIFSYLSYDLFSRASTTKLQNIGTQMFGGQVFINKSLSSGQNYNLIIENPENFAPGNMLLVETIENRQENDENRNLIIRNVTINYAINKDNQINMHVIRNNAREYAEQNINNFNEINRVFEALDANNQDNTKEKSKNSKAKNTSLTFINPTLLLFVDNQYKGSTIIPSFALQFNKDENASLLKMTLDSINYLTTQSDRAVLQLIKK